MIKHQLAECPRTILDIIIKKIDNHSTILLGISNTFLENS